VEDAPKKEHVPAVKKVLDMHSYQTGVIGAVTENSINEPVSPPSISNIDNMSQNEGFPKPVHRSLFKRRRQALDEESKSSPENLKDEQNNESITENVTNLLTKSTSLLNTLNEDSKIFNSDYLEIDRENAQRIS